MTAPSAIKIRVDAPVIQKGAKLEMTHYTYPVTFALHDGRELRFNRRYRDFESLYTQLSNKYWYCVIPPIPPKETLTQNVTAKIAPMMSGHADPADSSNASPTLTYRQNYLRRFLRRLAAHPELSRDPLFTEVFIDSAAWDRALNNPIPAPGFLSTSFVGNLKAMMSAAATSTSKAGKGASAVDMGEAATAYTNAVRQAEEGRLESIEYDKTRQFIAHLEQTFGNLETEMARLTQKRSDEGDALQSFGSAFRQLSLDEDDVRLRQSIDLVGKQSQGAGRIRVQHAQMELALASALGFLVGTCASVRETLERMLKAHEYSRQLEARVREVETQLNKGVPAANQESLRNDRDSAARLLSEHTQLLAAVLPKFAADFTDFHQTRLNDTQELVREIGKVEINAAEAMAAELRSLDTAVHTA